MTREEIKELALQAGFELKPQPDGSLDLHPYVYNFAKAVADKVTEMYDNLFDEDDE